MADKSITVVNFEQLELLLQNCVARSAANGTGKFASGSQLFIEVTGRTSGNNGVLHLKNGLNNDEYTSPDLTGGFANAAKFLGETILNHGNTNGKRNLITTSIDTTFEKPVAIKDGSTNIAAFTNGVITFYQQLNSFTVNSTNNSPLQVNGPTNFEGRVYIGGTDHELRFANDYLNITNNNSTPETVLQIHKDYIEARKAFRTANNIPFEANGLIYAGGHKLRYANDDLIIEDSNQKANVTFNVNWTNFWKKTTYLGNIKVCAQNDQGNAIMETNFDREGGQVIFGRYATFNSAAEFNGLMWCGGQEIRFPNNLEFKDNTDQHNTIFQITHEWANFYRPIAIVNCNFKVVNTNGGEVTIFQADGSGRECKIKIGNTELTETQLKQLLALLKENPSKTN